MCTVIVGFDPGAEVPLMVAAVRDEDLGRPWTPPAPHWPQDFPGLVGGLDLRSGGTWLAAGGGPEPGTGPRLGAVLNADPAAGPSAPTAPVLTRGRLPLRAARRGPSFLPEEDLHRYERFHLVAAGLDGASLLSWDGAALREERLPEGVSVVTNDGVHPHDPRALRHRAVFAASRPRPRAGDLDGPPAAVWGRWPALLDEAAGGPARTAGTGTEPDDPSALVARVRIGPDRTWATSSMALVAMAPGRVRFDFTADPGRPGAWQRIPPPR